MSRSAEEDGVNLVLLALKLHDKLGHAVRAVPEPRDPARVPYELGDCVGVEQDARTRVLKDLGQDSSHAFFNFSYIEYVLRNVETFGREEK
jgi:hypothetical protein